MISEVSRLAIIHDPNPAPFLMMVIRLHWEAHPVLDNHDNLIIMNKSHYHELMAIIREYHQLMEGLRKHVDPNV